MAVISAVRDLFDSLPVEAGKRATVLAVGLPELGDDSGEIQVVHADSGQAAFEMLCVLDVDLVLVPHVLSDMPATQFADDLHETWPWQRWGLVSHTLSIAQELAVRQRSVLGVFEHVGAPSRN
jgi:hypothetical protein